MPSVFVHESFGPRPVPWGRQDRKSSAHCNMFSMTFDTTRVSSDRKHLACIFKIRPDATVISFATELWLLLKTDRLQDLHAQSFT